MNNLATDLALLRGRLGLSEHAMAELLYTSQQTYQTWEAGSQPRSGTVARLARFVESANDQLIMLGESGVEMSSLLPLNLASSTLGIPHEILFHAYRDGRFEAVDLGILGVWVQRNSLQQILEAVLR